jgi:hypothetical protein
MARGPYLGWVFATYLLEGGIHTIPHPKPWALGFPMSRIAGGGEHAADLANGTGSELHVVLVGHTCRW